MTCALKVIQQTMREQRKYFSPSAYIRLKVTFRRQSNETHAYSRYIPTRWHLVWISRWVEWNRKWSSIIARTTEWEWIRFELIAHRPTRYWIEGRKFWEMTVSRLLGNRVGSKKYPPGVPSPLVNSTVRSIAFSLSRITYRSSPLVAVEFRRRIETCHYTAQEKRWGNDRGYWSRVQLRWVFFGRYPIVDRMTKTIQQRRRRPETLGQRHRWRISRKTPVLTNLSIKWIVTHWWMSQMSLFSTIT